MQDLYVCSIFAEVLCAHGIDAVKPAEVEVLPTNAKLLVALPDDTEGRREAAHAIRLAQRGGIECAIDWKAHDRIAERFGYTENESGGPDDEDGGAQ